MKILYLLIIVAALLQVSGCGTRFHVHETRIVPREEVVIAPAPRVFYY